MADLKFKPAGLRILDSREGDLLIADPRLDMQLMLTSEFLLAASNDPQKMGWLGRKFLDFIQKHTEARWKSVKKDLTEIETQDKAFVASLSWRLKTKAMDNLRKLEKDVYFWKFEHGKIEHNNKFKPYEKNN